MKIIQTDADNTIYKGNLLVSLGWLYLSYLLKNKRYIKFISRLIELPFFYFLSTIPSFIGLAFLPFRGCPVGLASKIANPINKKWLKKIKELNPKKIVIVSHQDFTLLKEYTQKLRYSFCFISNKMEIKDNRFTGRADVMITPKTKYNYVDSSLFYIGDKKDFVHYGKRNKRFILI